MDDGRARRRGFSFGSLYIFSQALGLVWMFLVVLLAVMSVRIVTLSMNKAVQHLSTEQHENDQCLVSTSFGLLYNQGDRRID